MSEGKMCDEGYDVRFKGDIATVSNAEGKVLMTFHRKNGGLYIAKLKLKQPFGRQGS